MQPTEIADQLEVILDKEQNDLATKGYSFYQRVNAKDITYPNAETLIELFSTLGNDNSLKLVFVEALKEKIRDSEEYACRQQTGEIFWVSTAAICFYTLVELGYRNDAIESFEKRQKPAHTLHLLLISILNGNYFDSSQLKAISKIINDGKHDSDISGLVRSKLVQARFDLLKTSVKKINVEINQDKKSVSEKIGLLGLSDNYNELLKCMDDFIFADTSKVVNAGMISALRTFMASLLKDIANRVASKEGSGMPHLAGRSEMGDIRVYLKSKLELSEADDKFIDSFVNILHAEGGHSFLSEKEYFRLSRNIAIEITLFLLSKFEKKFVK